MQTVKYKVEYIDVNKLHSHPENPRILKDEQFEILCQSIKDNLEYFETRPVICDTKFTIWAGNMRFRAGKHIGMKAVPTVVLDLPEEKLREIMIRDNVQNGEWDVGLLASLYQNEELERWGVDLSQFGVSPEEIEPNEADDAIPDAVGEGSVSVGDIYILGKHRVMCGDSTDIEAVGKLMNGKLADILVTDPPYNVDYTGKTEDALKIENDKKTDEEFAQFLTDAFTTANQYLKEGGAFYIWHADSEGFNFRSACHKVGWKVRQCLIWNKNTLVMGRQDYHWKHEPCLYGWKDGASHLWNNDRKQTTVLDFMRPSRSAEHPTMKPVELMAYNITNNTHKGDIVLDLFLGSGTTLIASDKMDRICYGMELDPKYVAVIIKRWEDYTGNKAVKL